MNHAPLHIEHKIVALRFANKSTRSARSIIAPLRAPKSRLGFHFKIREMLGLSRPQGVFHFKIRGMDLSTSRRYTTQRFISEFSSAVPFCHRWIVTMACEKCTVFSLLPRSPFPSLYKAPEFWSFLFSYFLADDVVFVVRSLSLLARRSWPRWSYRTSGRKGPATPPRAADERSTRTSSSPGRTGPWSLLRSFLRFLGSGSCGNPHSLFW